MNYCFEMNPRVRNFAECYAKVTGCFNCGWWACYQRELRVQIDYLIWLVLWELLLDAHLPERVASWADFDGQVENARVAYAREPLRNLGDRESVYDEKT